MTAEPPAPDTIVLIHGLWMTPRSWEHWVPYYEEKGYKVLTPTYPGFEVEVEALREDPSVDRLAHRAGDRGAPRERHHRARPAADHHGPLLRWNAHAAPARPRLRRRRRRDQLRPHRGRARQPAVSDQVAVSDPQESGEPPQGGRIHARSSSTTPSPTRSARRSRRRSTTGITSPRRGTGSGPTASSPTSSRATRRRG